MSKELLPKDKKSVDDANLATKRNRKIEMASRRRKDHFINKLAGGRGPKECRELDEILKEDE